MNTLLLEKIKKALKGSYPVETIKEIVREFEEIERLVKWRESIILSGDIEKHRKEIDKISDLMLEYRYPYDIHEDSMDAIVKKYIKNYKKKS